MPWRRANSCISLHEIQILIPSLLILRRQCGKEFEQLQLNENLWVL
jgi:hypothetical protein